VFYTPWYLIWGIQCFAYTWVCRLSEITYLFTMKRTVSLSWNKELSWQIIVIRKQCRQLFIVLVYCNRTVSQWFINISNYFQPVRSLLESRVHWHVINLVQPVMANSVDIFTSKYLQLNTLSHLVSYSDHLFFPLCGGKEKKAAFSVPGVGFWSF